MDSNNNIATFSSAGKIDFCAPGVDIYSTYLASGYTSLGGTSMATPHITGEIALYLENKPSANTTEVRDYLISKCRDLGSEGLDNFYGFGMPVLN
ncbi:MAG: S8 family serine peptidase [Clostridia bacterium]|nr:S8 family serine peptidase [Clostridia bacterium]